MEDKISHILVVIDPTVTTSQQHALMRARALARAFRARVELFVCHVPGSGGELHAEGPWLERLADGLRARGIETTTSEASDNSVHAGVLSKVLDARPSLVIKDTHPHSLLRRTLVANTDWQLIRLCPVPLLFVRSGAWKRAPRIAAAVDISLPGEKPAALDNLLLSTAEAFALATDGLVHAVHAYQPVTGLVATGTALAVPLADGDSGRVIGDSELLAREQFDELLSTHRVPADSRHLLIGAPTEALPCFVREKEIDLLVMGAFARGWMYNVLVGSTTERVLDVLPCDVLVMKPASFRCPLQVAATERVQAARPA